MTVFRTQQAYSRYWEARGQLGAIMACVVDAALAGVRTNSGAHATRSGVRRGRSSRGRAWMYFREVVRFLRRASRETQRISNYWLPEEAIAAIVKEDTCDAEATEAECALIQATPRPPVLVLQWVQAHLQGVGGRARLAQRRDRSRERQQLLSLGVERIIAKIQPYQPRWGDRDDADAAATRRRPLAGLLVCVHGAVRAHQQLHGRRNVVATVPASMLSYHTWARVPRQPAEEPVRRRVW